MKNKLIKTLKISLPIAIGVYLTWYFVSNSTETEKEYFLKSLSEANYGWVLAALIIAFCSHLSRAYRWKYLLETLDLKPKLSLMYHSVMIGYIINLTIPRSGELARAAYFSRYQKTKSDQIFGTIVIERVIDLIMFGLVFFIAFLFQADQDKFNELRQISNSSSNPYLLPSLLIFGIIFIGILIGVKKVRVKVVDFLKGIIQGATAILKLKYKTAFANMKKVHFYKRINGEFIKTIFYISENDKVYINTEDKINGFSNLKLNKEESILITKFDGPSETSTIKSISESNINPKFESEILDLYELQKKSEIWINSSEINSLESKLKYFVFHTFFIWACYISMLWITALALPDIENITINAVFACFIAGTIAIGATPGGIGLYPIMVASALIELYGYDGQVAKSFGMLMWSSQTIFMILLGIISLIAIKKEN
jgi:uncharacterized membrane protein YbhN (UPF0104 family)